MSKERYLEQEINKDLKIANLESQLEEVQKENTQLKEMREHLKWKDETRKEKERLERQLAEAREEQVRFLSMLLPYIHPSSTCEVYKSVCKRLAKLKEQG